MFIFSQNNTYVVGSQRDCFYEHPKCMFKLVDKILQFYAQKFAIRLDLFVLLYGLPLNQVKAC